MRFRYALMLSVVLALGTACGGIQVASFIQPTATPTAAPLVRPYQPGTPMLSQADAMAAAERDLDEQGFKWTQPPRAVLVQEMSYEEAKALIGHGDADADYQFTPRETRVWFVIYQGKWTLEPMGPPGAPPNAYEGCLLRVFMARDGSVLAAGDSLCPE